MEFSALVSYFQCLHTHDQGFRRAWRHLGPVRQREYWRLLNQIELLRARLERPHTQTSEIFNAHQWAARRTSALFDHTREWPFQHEPEPESWTQAASDCQRKLRSFFAWRSRILSFANTHQTLCKRVYGGLKSTSSLRSKLEAHRTGQCSLDLWDAIRFRIVVRDVETLATMADSFCSSFGPMVIRCRNYYVRPRGGESDPYRAVHFELASQKNDYTEVQFLTLVRDAVGLLDHALIHKKAARIVTEAQEVWLSGFSLAANVVDSRLAGDEVWSRLLQSGWSTRPRASTPTSAPAHGKELICRARRQSPLL
jgi:hypothetical protein